MRHAKQTGATVRDHDRPLTDEGHDDAHQVGVRLAAEPPLPTHILSSTALRCRETWSAVAAGMASELIPEFESKLYNASSDEILNAIAGIGDEVESLMVLAHNPGISMLALNLAGPDPNDTEAAQGGFMPATTARFSVEGSWSTLTPRTATLKQFDRP